MGLRKELKERLSKLPDLLFLKKDFCDVKLICEGKVFECHKCVLSCQSDVFQAMFSLEWAKCEESKSGEVKIEDFDADTVESMVYFMYHNKVSDEKMSNSGFGSYY